jgi:hypothetical protein
MKQNWHYDLDKVKEWAKGKGLSVVKQDPPCGLDVEDEYGKVVISICNDCPTIIISCNLNDVKKVTALAKSLHRYCKVRREIK